VISIDFVLVFVSRSYRGTCPIIIIIIIIIITIISICPLIIAHFWISFSALFQTQAAGEFAALL